MEYQNITRVKKNVERGVYTTTGSEGGILVTIFSRARANSSYSVLASCVVNEADPADAVMVYNTAKSATLMILTLRHCRIVASKITPSYSQIPAGSKIYWEVYDI